MYAKVLSSALSGIDGINIDLEIDLANGLPQFQIVGLPDSAIRESKDRVRAAIKNSGYDFPIKRITANLAPADIKKEGSGFDLPIAIGILLASEQFKTNLVELDKTIFIGELSLDGTIQPINGILSMAMAAKNNNINNLIIPIDNASEARLVEGIHIYGFSHINEVINFLESGSYDMNISNTEEAKGFSPVEEEIDDFIDVKGHYLVKRAIEVAVAGMHNLLMIGPPGSGKSMIAKRISSVLPALSWDEILEITKIYSAAGELKDNSKVIRKRPFRSPHHSVSTSGLIGGGSIPKSGEISLAHRGILFLDELPEFARGSLESLRQPLEDGKVVISRARANHQFPAEIMLVGAMNPCKCGYYGTNVPNHQCQCTPLEVQKYRKKISGPLLDRIDIQVEVPWNNIETLRNNREEKSSLQMREQIARARNIQNERFKDKRNKFNSEMDAKQVKTYCILDKKAEELLHKSFDHYGFSGRSLNRILKIGRTIADLEESPTILSSHLAEAINYRVLDKK